MKPIIEIFVNSIIELFVNTIGEILVAILTVREEIILSALWMLGRSAFGGILRSKVVEFSKKDIVYGTLYNLLEILIRKGYVISSKDVPTPVQGGKAMTIYKLTEEGITALKETKEMHENIWEKWPKLEPGVSNQ